MHAKQVLNIKHKSRVEGIITRSKCWSEDDKIVDYKENKGR